MIHPTIETLRRLRLTGMAKALEEQQGLPDCDRLFDERLAIDREAVERDNAALAQTSAPCQVTPVGLLDQPASPLDGGDPEPFVLIPFKSTSPRSDP